MAEPQKAKPSGVRERLKVIARPDNRETDDRAAMPRLVSAFTSAVIAGYWIGPLWAIAWLAAITVNERLISPFLIAKVITPNFEKRPHLVEWTVIGMSVGGAALYAASWIAAWMIGGHQYSFFAAMALSAT